MPSRSILALTTAFLAACSAEPAGPTGLDPLHLAITGAKPSGGGGAPMSDNVPLVVVFRDQPGDAIGSDGAGPYQDGAAGVRAWQFTDPEYDFYGQLHLHTHWDSRSAGRTLRIDLSASGSLVGNFAAGFQVGHAELEAFNTLGG